MNGFSVEESNLISIFATEGGAFSLKSRRSVIEDIIVKVSQSAGL